MTNKVNNWFEELNADQRVPLMVLRELVLASGKNISEEIKWSRPCYSHNALFCYLHAFKNYVVIGFHQGASLDDPKGLLQGDGKNLRHVKIGFDEKIDKTAIKQLLKNALELDDA